MFNAYGTEPGRATPGHSETTPKEKAAGVLDTPTTASKDQCKASVSAAEKTGKPDAKQYATLQAQFALLGRTLTRSHRAHDGRISYVVARLSEARYFSHWSDVQAHLAALGCKR